MGLLMMLLGFGHLGGDSWIFEVLGRRVPWMKYWKARMPPRMPPRWALLAISVLPGSSRKMREKSSMERRDQKRTLGFRLMGMTKKRRRVMGWLGRRRQKNEMRPMAPAEAPRRASWVLNLMRSQRRAPERMEER